MPVGSQCIQPARFRSACQKKGAKASGRAKTAGTSTGARTSAGTSTAADTGAADHTGAAARTGTAAATATRSEAIAIPRTIDGVDLVFTAYFPRISGPAKRLLILFSASIPAPDVAPRLSGRASSAWQLLPEL